MKTLSSLIAVAAFAAATPAIAGDVTINLTGVQAKQGDLYVALQSRDQFLKDAGSNGVIIKVPQKGDHKAVLKNVPAGDWSVSVWHDSDADKKFSMDNAGMPTDGWTMNKADELRGAPVWDQVKFTVPEKGTSLTLAMIYPR